MGWHAVCGTDRGIKVFLLFHKIKRRQIMNNLMRRDQSYDWPFFSDIFDVDRFFGTPYFNNSQRSPAVNIQENDKEYDIDVFAPGFKKEDFSVEVDNDMLHIKAENHGETTDKEKKNFTRKEYHY